MLSRKLQIAIFAAFTAIGLAFAPVAALAKSDHHDSGKGGSHKSSGWGHKGSKWASVKHDGANGKHDKGGKHDKHDKHGKHDKWDKWKHKDHAHWHHKWHHKKYYYEEPTTYSYVKPVYSSPSYSKPTYAYSSEPSSPCTCLTKEYDRDHNVIFKDLCTKEMAVYSKDDDD